TAVGDYARLVEPPDATAGMHPAGQALPSTPDSSGLFLCQIHTASRRWRSGLVSHVAFFSAAAGLGAGAGSGGLVQTGCGSTLEAAIAVGFSVAWPQAVSSGSLA